ncbi:hypothetical protein MMC28_004860 [Mycoblastus sanguinarius]|nr:hypothetical protein [Mycoblastus sanguinarius]
MDIETLQKLLQSVRDFCAFIIRDSGDSWLPPSLDPYTWNGPYGGSLMTRSVLDQHITFGIMKSTMQGLLDILVIGEKNYQVDVEISDLNCGLMGVANVTETAGSVGIA